MATDIASSPGRVVALNEQAAKPGANTKTGYLYTKSSGGQTELFYENDAGTEEQLTSGGSSTVTGSGTANYIAYWTSGSNLTGTSGLTYDGTTLTQTPTATIVSGASAVANIHTVAAATVTLSGSTSITTALGFNIASIKQATLSAASALTITSAAGLYVEAPIGGGAGPATLTNEHAIWGLSPTAKTATVSDVLRLEHQSSGTPAANFGTGILFRGQDASKTAAGDDICRIATYWTTATSGAEASALGIGLRVGGAVLPTPGTANAEQLTIASTGDMVINPVGATGVNVTIGNTAAGTTGSNRLAFKTVSRTCNIDFGNSTNELAFSSAGSYKFGNVIFAANGSVSSPAYNFTNDIDTGIYSVSTSNIIGITSHGVLGFQVADSTVASAAGATLERITAPAQTVTISGSTGITTATGFNLFTVGQPTYSAASALTITTGATAAIGGAPVVAGAGPAALTGAYSLLVGGATTMTNIAGTLYSPIGVLAHTLTLAATTQITSVGPVGGLSIGQLTVAQSGGAVTVNSCSSLYIAAAPTPGASVTLTKAYSLWIDAGLVRLDSTTANSTTACVFTAASGPSGANTAIQEWLTIDINGTTRFIPCW